MGGAISWAFLLFRDGAVQMVNSARRPAKLDLKEAIVCFGNGKWKEQFSFGEAEAIRGPIVFFPNPKLYKRMSVCPAR
jgi:hypothetical protein